MALRAWFRPPRHVLTIFIAVALLSGCALGWLGWLLWQQDNAVDVQRRRERLEEAADRAVAVMDRALQGIEAQLGPAPVRHLPEGVTLLTTGGDGDIVVKGGPRLIYYPVAKGLPEAASDTFAEAERLEFAGQDPAAAARAYQALSKSTPPPIRAGALARLARVLRKMGHLAEAARTYEELGSISAAVAGIPAGVIARDGLAELMAKEHRADGLRRHAEAFRADLKAGTWQLTKEQLAFYQSEADGWLGSRTAEDADALARAEAFDTIWRDRRVDAGVSRRIIYASGSPALALWRRSEGSLDVAIAGRSFIEALCQEAVPSRDVRTALTDVEGRPILGAPTRERDVAARAAVSTQLPWTVYLSTAPSASAPGSLRRRLLLALFAVLTGVIAVGAYFIQRAISRELLVSALQTDFVAAVSHEFRSPLSSLAQISEMLARDRFPTEDLRRRSYDVLVRETERLRRLVEGLLDFGRLEAGAALYRFETFDVTEFVGTVVAEFRERAAAQGFDVELSAPKVELLVRADREALSRAIQNLLDNAVKYSPECRTVWVDVEGKEDRVSIAVRDRGLGIPAHEQRDVFKKFVRGAESKSLRIKGTGIGLAMVRHIVEAHGGEVVLASEPGRGSRFTMILRAAGEAS